MSGSTTRQLLNQLAAAREAAAAYEDKMAKALDAEDRDAFSVHMNEWLLLLEDIDELAALLAQFA